MIINIIYIISIVYMNGNPYAQIDDLLKANKIYRFETELTNTVNKDRCKMISDILNKIRLIKNPETIKTEQMNDYVKILVESQYKKKWHVLNLDQKLDRINTYLIELGIDTDVKLKNKIIKCVKNAEIKTKDIKYDFNAGKIMQITLLQKNDDGSYKLNIKDSTTKAKTKEIKEIKEPKESKDKTDKIKSVSKVSRK